MKLISLLFLVFARTVFSQELIFKKIEIDTNFSFRGLSVADDSVVWVSGNGFGRSIDGGETWEFQKIKGFEKSDFRTLYAFDSQNAIIANAGSPAYLLRTGDGGKNWNVVYKNSDTLAFFDGIDFWNEQEGLLYGDPINGKMLVLLTKDGGKNWMEFPDESRPDLSEGEASFAASGTGIRCYYNQKAVISTGGKVSRLIISDDKGKNWTSVKTPILQGKLSTGIFSVAFLNDSLGIIAGGDYLVDTVKTSHVFYTADAGKNWLSPTQPTGGYRECVEFIKGNVAMAVGPGGTDVSYNAGMKWIPVENEKNFHVIRKARNGKLVVAAGKGKISLVHYEGID